MKKLLTTDFLKRVTRHEVFKYLVAGVLTTIFYAILRIVIIYPILKNATLTTTIANVLAIVFAFVVNDTYAFNQARQGWQSRFVKFFLARLSTLSLDTGLAYLLVDQFPGIIGQFVGNNMSWVNAIATLIGQVLIMVTNYVISKFFIFKNKK
ncbi:GtrA family protein [Streptococcus caviae]|uniref:GtrA family protein n=1 Tax=Streptococcus sp. 'caviae' TaxID=1915004 RepID=UPI00094BBED1|nr:GtrA family protein [Streptococcus sp. 'caviae']OLN84205.1 sugar translocase [Streptococcus sp. 'caviae']